jgi:ribosomal protein S6--L-glutamate ligase
MARSVYYLQEYIPHDGRDIRIFTVGDRVFASMERVSSNWKTNISGGGKPVVYEPIDEETEVSLKAVKNLGLEYAGVDLLRSKNDNGLYVLELNSTPGWQGLQTVSDTDITKAVVEHTLSLVE